MVYSKAKIDYNQKTRDILDSALENASRAEKDELPTTKTLKRSILNNKNKSNPTYFKEPTSLSTIIATDVERFVFRGTAILYYESGKDDPERFFVFTSDEFVKILQECTIIGVDATFKLSVLRSHMFIGEDVLGLSYLGRSSFVRTIGTAMGDSWIRGKGICTVGIFSNATSTSGELC